MNNVNITYSTSGLGAPSLGADHISGMIFYTSAYPSGFSATANTFNILSTDDALALGITGATAISAATNIDVIKYHIDQYFAANPKGDLWLKITTSASTASTYSEIVDLQNASNGKIRQVGIFENIAFSTTSLQTIQSQIDTCIANNKPLEAIYQANITGSLTSLADLNTLSNANVSVLVGQDGANLGSRLFAKLGYSIGMMGLCLGAISRANVATSIAWVQNFNMATTAEFDTIAFANGALYDSQSDNLLNQIDAKRYLFLRKFVDQTGSYFNNDYSANVSTSDYSFIHLNRTIHKVHREVRKRLLPTVSSPILFNADGTIKSYSIAFFSATAGAALAQMVSNSEISNYKVIINPAQNVLSTRILNITCQVQPVGVADMINVNIGFVLAI